MNDGNKSSNQAFFANVMASICLASSCCFVEGNIQHMAYNGAWGNLNKIAKQKHNDYAIMQMKYLSHS